MGLRPRKQYMGIKGKEGHLGVGEPSRLETFGSQAFVASLEKT